MPKMHIEESINIKAGVEKVSIQLQDFNQWRKWSPWIILEPETVVDVRPDGKSYSWDGKRVGSGEMSITKVEENKRIDMDLVFLKPWKSKAKVWFLLEENGSETKVTWLMDSSLPFFLFWMKKMMEVYLAMDYKRGLEMLKDLLEDGQVHCKLDFEGEINYPGCKYIAIKTDCTVDQLGSKMSEDFTRLGEFVKENKIKPAELPFSIYHKMDFVKDRVVYTSGIPVESIPDTLPQDIISGGLPAIKIYSIKSTGPYRHIGNAWSAGAMMQRAKEFKSQKKVHPFELYINSPEEVEENKLETRICFPVMR